MTETQSGLLVQRKGNIVLLTINRPAARNAIDPQTAVAISHAMDALDADPAVVAAIITGAGGYFCAGQDLKSVAQGRPSLTEKRGGFGIMKLPAMKPLIAACEGPVLAGGLELALSCDLIVAAENCVFGVPEVKRSLVALGGALMRLPRRIPYHIAMELLLTGETASAQRMYEVGLVNRIAKPGGALAAAFELARAIECNGPLAVQASKEVAWRHSAEGWDEARGWDEQMRISAPTLASEDMKEGIAAFTEKRAPIWRGR